MTPSLSEEEKPKDIKKPVVQTAAQKIIAKAKKAKAQKPSGDKKKVDKDETQKISVPKKIKSPAKKELEKATEDESKKEEKNKDPKEEEAVMPDDISVVSSLFIIIWISYLIRNCKINELLGPQRKM